ncbi:MAG: TonB-dependent receptor plug domain-containing protein, partial [Bacteroidales bacterium]|nr:TonB-dependent receptor plug domain-containing protein [Bacteroidales bacterium]
MRKIVWIALLCLITTLSYGQTVRVVDKQTEQALEFVAIIANQGKTVVITDVNGQANISLMKDAPKIEFRMMGYQQVCFSYNQLNDKQFLVSLEPKSLNLECVVVSASRFLQSSDEVPVKVIQAKEVAIQNPQTTADLLSLSGNVFIQKSQLGGGSPMIRGFATNRLVYSVDGIRMNTAIYRSGNIQNVISLDPLSIESTEILFGPASVIYGSDAIGGVMSFQTLTAPLSNDKNNIQGGRAFMRYSSANHEMTGHFDAFAGFKKWSFLTSISQSTFGDLKMGSHGPEEYLRYNYVQRIDSQDVVVSNADPLVQSPSGYSQQNLMQKIRFKPNNYLDFQYGFHYSETSAYARYDRHLQTKNGLPKYAEWSYGPQKWMMNNLNISYSKSNIAFDELVLRLAQQSFEESRISRSFNKDTREIRTEKV